VLYVSGNQGQLFNQRGRRDQCVLFFQGRISSPKVGIGSGDPVVQRNDPVPAEGKQNSMALGFFQPRLGQKLLLCHDGVINLKSPVFKNRQEKAGIEIVDHDVGVDQELNFCHARISLRKASSDR